MKKKPKNYTVHKPFRKNDAAILNWITFEIAHIKRLTNPTCAQQDWLPWARARVVELKLDMEVAA